MPDRERIPPSPDGLRFGVPRKAFEFQARELQDARAEIEQLRAELAEWKARCRNLTDPNPGGMATGQRSGEKMHKARHTAGQRLLDDSKNLKAVQMFMGHADISTTGNTYVGWDEDALAESLRSMLDHNEED